MVTEKSVLEWEQLQLAPLERVRLDLTIHYDGPEGRAQVAYRVSDPTGEKVIALGVNTPVWLGQVLEEAIGVLHACNAEAFRRLAPF